MEKAIIDYFYINPSVRTEDDFSSLRLNKEEILSQLNKKRLREYMRRFNQKRLSNRVEYFFEWLEIP